MLTTDEIRSRAKALMPGLTEDLKDLVSHASCSFPGYPEEPVTRHAPGLDGAPREARGRGS